MFFKREKPQVSSFQERIANLKNYGFESMPEGSSGVRAVRDGIGATITDIPGERPHVAKAGMLVGNEIALLVNGGYQQFWLTPGGRRVPALAPQLKALHAFEEDAKEALGLPSLYNTSLGTTSALHLYDRVEDRDRPADHKPWEVKTPSPAQS